jgi:hypothetical protein
MPNKDNLTLGRSPLGDDMVEIRCRIPSQDKQRLIEIGGGPKSIGKAIHQLLVEHSQKSN